MRTAMENALVLDQIRAELVNIFQQDLFVADRDIHDDDELITDLGLDSSNFAVALVVIEERFGVVVRQRSLIECTTFGDVVDLISRAAGDSDHGV